METPPKKIIRHYLTDKKSDPFRKWFEKLKDGRAKAAIQNRLDRITNDGNFGDSEPVGGGVFELRFFIGPGYRIYFGEDGDVLVILLGGSDKDTQVEEIKKAKQRWNDYNA